MGTADNKFVEFVIDKNFNLTLYFNSTIVLVLIFLLLILIILFFYKSFDGFLSLKKFEIDTAEFGLGNQKFSLKPNLIDMQVAYNIWVELSTRKIGLPINLEDDVIIEIYDSWYNFFAVTRELIKDIPVSRFRRKDTERIIHLSIEVLNEGLRPHLTKWQARFRRWYEKKIGLDSVNDIEPQEIQKQFPAFSDLSKELLEVNKNLMAYRKKMYNLISKTE